MTLIIRLAETFPSHLVILFIINLTSIKAKYKSHAQLKTIKQSNPQQKTQDIEIKQN